MIAFSAEIQRRVDEALKKAIGPTRAVPDLPYVDNGSRGCLECDTDWIGPAPCFLCERPGVHYTDMDSPTRTSHALCSPAEIRFGTEP